MSKFKVKDLRTKLLIEPTLQKKIIGNFFLIGITITLINLVSFYFLVDKIIDQVSGIAQVNLEMLEIIQHTCVYLIVSSLVMSVFALVGFCIYGLYFSNRIAGPIYNLNKVVGRILNGEKNVRVQFRKNDYFQDLSEQMNLLLDQRAGTPRVDGGPNSDGTSGNNSSPA